MRYHYGTSQTTEVDHDHPNRKPKGGLWKIHSSSKYLCRPSKNRARCGFGRCGSTVYIYKLDNGSGSKTYLNTVHSVQKYENIRETPLDLSQRYEFVIVDAAGRDSRELRTGMIAADILFVPFRPSQPDLDTLQNLQQIIIPSTDLNPKHIVYGVLNNAPTNPSIHESDEARDYLLDYPEIMLLKPQ